MRQRFQRFCHADSAIRRGAVGAGCPQLPLWGCEVTRGKPAGKHPAKSIETEREALIGQRRGDKEMLVEDIVSR